MHLNDTKKDFGSRVDRHDEIGKGFLGFEPFKWIISDSCFENIPLILKTPNEAGWKQEIELLRSFI